MLKLNKLLACGIMGIGLMLSATEMATAGFEEAVKAYEAGDYKTALAEWTVLAEQNDPAAMRNIGHLYRRGLGTKQNFERAMHWYMRASKLGFPRAQANVASMYLRGQGVKQDYVKAAEWFTKAARNGHTIAQYNLGLMYEYGKGVEKSTSKALAWYNLAAKAGHPKALNKLSLLVATNPDVKADKDISAQQKKPVQIAKPESVTEPVAKPIVKVVEKPTVKPVVKPVAKVVAKPAPKPKLEPKPVSKPIVKMVKKAEVKEVELPEKAQIKPVMPSVKKRKDPFAGSANNLALAKVEKNGAPTVFNQNKVVAPPAVTQEVVKPVTVATAAPEPASPLKMAQKPAPEPVAAVKADALAPPSVTKSTSAVKKEESKGFFSSLKSLILGDDEKSGDEAIPAPDAKNSSVVVAKVAPQPAIEPPTPAPVQKIETVVPGQGLSVAEQLEMADLSFSLEDYQQALNVLAPLAQQGNPTAQFRLGQMFSEGYAVPIDRVTAYYWWSKAKANGSNAAAASLAKLEGTLTFLEKRRLKQVN